MPSAANACRTVVVILLAMSAGVLGGGESPGSALRTLTGRHTRLVWVQDAGPTACVYVEKPTVLLMGLDSDDNAGERAIVAKPGSFYRPVLTADGERVVFTRGSPVAKADIAHAVCVVPFAGGEPTVVVPDAVAEDVWTDPADGVTWVYAGVSEQRGGAPVTTLRRYHLDDPTTSELVWDRTGFGHIQVSGDGNAASGGASGQGLFYLPNEAFGSAGGGCWPSMSPDDSHRFWVFTGSHRSANLFRPVEYGSLKFDSWNVDFSQAPGIPRTCEVYHPRWSNDLRYLTMTGPYASFAWADEAKITNEVAAGVEVYLGRFSEDLHRVEQWITITHNQRGDYFPDAWIQPEATARPATRHAPPAKAPTPGAVDAGLQFQFLDARSANQVPEADGKRIRLCNVKLTGGARYGRFGLVECSGGAAVASDGAAVLAACRSARALSLSCTIAPAATQVADPATVAVVADAAGASDLALLQVGGRLQVRVGRGKATTVDLGEVEAGRATHVAVTVADGQLRCYRDGGRVLVEEPAVDLAAWTADTIRFGADADGARAWSGSVCDLAIRSRALDAAEAGAHAVAAAERAAARVPAARVVVDAVLAGHTDAADPRAIAPYLRCLSLSTYDVASVVDGTLADKRIAVFQWSVLDGARVPEYEAMTVGDTRRLVLEAFADHPEQESSVRPTRWTAPTACPCSTTWRSR